ncbi:MAG: arginine--tRNA ligase [Chloroflexi bacterium]|nr:arginine--tRNA ligase [Chloroflexota bacterium]
MFDAEILKLTVSLREALDRVHIPYPQEIQWNPTPFRGRWGVGTAIAFQAAALEGKEADVQMRAQEIAELAAREIDSPAAFELVQAEKAYINAYFDIPKYAARVVDTVLQQKEDFGRGAPKGERVMVEYAQPNTHHSFHIGHARNTVLGESLARLVEFAGFETVRASYPGDIGLGVITCVWAYQKFHYGQEPEGVHERGQWLARIYHEASTLVTPKEDETREERELREQYDAERREMFRLWDSKDPEIRELWLKTREWSLDELYDILGMLGAEIDVYFFESEMDEPAKEIVEELIALGIAEDERPSGPVFVKIDEKLGLDRDKYRTSVLLRQDGTTLYSAKDLALAKRKFDTYDVDRSVYVVDVRQSLHFDQVFKILELWGFEQAKKSHHLSYGFVTLPGGMMSSRMGNVVLFMDVVAEAQRRVLDIIAEKNPSLSEDERAVVARQVGLGALNYALISVDNTKEIVFDWDKALSFEGQSAPYIQNAHVRANSILRKSEGVPDEASFDYELLEMESELIERISQFPEVVQRAATEYKPLHMSNYAFELARTFHAFYHAVPVLRSEEREARIRLTAAAKQTLANSLRLLDVEAPDRM